VTPDQYWQGLADLLEEAIGSDEPPSPADAIAPLLWLSSVVSAETDMPKDVFLEMCSNVYDEAFVASASEDDLSIKLRLNPKKEEPN